MECSPDLHMLISTLYCHSGEHSDVNPTNNYIDPSVIDYDYSKEPLLCFTCHFSRTEEHDQGMKNCDEPFTEEGIPSIKCEGPCAVTNTSMGEYSYMIMRSCMPNCKDISDPESTVTCCSTNKCNGRTHRNIEMVTVIGTGSMIVTMAIMCMLLCARK